MQILKRNGLFQDFDQTKIKNAIQKAFIGIQETISEEDLYLLLSEIQETITDGSSVEEIQDHVEEALMRHGYLRVAKAYILYRQHHTELRQAAEELTDRIPDPALPPLLSQIQKDFPEEVYSLPILALKFRSFYKEGMTLSAAYATLERASVELISKEAPQWEMIAARFLSLDLEHRIQEQEKLMGFSNWYEKLSWLTKEGYIGAFLLENYSREDIARLAAFLKPERNSLFNYSGLDLLAKRYLICDHGHQLLERPQEMFMGIAMHLAIPEKDRVYWAKKFYEILSTLKVTMATPTMANARKPFHQMSSCFIDTVEDSLTGIYRSIDNFAQVSKHGGGMGLYFGKVRANGSSIRGFEGAAGGVIRWIKLVNDTATAVDQLGVRQGAAAIYLDAWHRDLPEFLQLRTNNGDDRMKAHDIFPAVCYPDLFWKLAKSNLDADWYLMCPHNIYTVKGYHLEDFYGDEWETRYYDCIADDRIQKRIMSIKEILRLIIKSLVETGTPFAFNRDTVNRMNPNGHQGMIYCSNLCTEIAQNMSAMQVEEPETLQIDGETVVVQKTRPGNFVVCNLASLTLGRINVKDDADLWNTISTVVRALDNVIDLNYYPVPYAKITNQQYRAIGLGTSGYHHMLVNQGFSFESLEHLDFVDHLYEKINYYTLKASMELSAEKGAYAYFEGSDFQTGAYFSKRGYNSPEWKKLENEIQKHGLRNGYLLAVAPTSSTSIIAGTTAAVDPVMKKYFMEEKKGSMITRVAPDLNQKTFWLYKNAHHIEQTWVVDAAGVRQRHIDQAQSVNLYITNAFTFRRLLELYIRAWEKGVKTIYYVRSQSLEVEECESCSS